MLQLQVGCHRALLEGAQRAAQLRLSRRMLCLLCQVQCHGALLKLPGKVKGGQGRPIDLLLLLLLLLERLRQPVWCTHS